MKENHDRENVFEYRSSADRLMVIVPDRLSDLLSKGEVVERYYNPGDMFREVHFMMTNDDSPDIASLQRMVGTAKVFVYNLPSPTFKGTLGWQFFLLKRWSRPAVEIARRIGPNLIRCHGNDLNTYLGARIRSELGVPLVFSLHINPDDDMRFHARRDGRWKEWLFLSLFRKVERWNIQTANVVICVYDFIRPYVERLGGRDVRVIYNAVSPDSIVRKTDYSISSPVRLILPGRHHPQKDPSPMIEALRSLPEAELTLVGKGGITDDLKRKAKEWGVAERCLFLDSMPNAELCEKLHTYDMLVSINSYGGVSKVEIEAALAGLPIVTNAHPMEKRPELLGERCVTTDGSPASYAEAVRKLAGSRELRESTGKGVRENARVVSPDRMERKLVETYRELLA